MRIRFLLWAQLRVAAGAAEVEIDLPEGASVRDALEALDRAHPEVAARRAGARVAVGNEYAAPDRGLAAGDQVSLIPPVQGG